MVRKLSFVVLLALTVGMEGHNRRVSRVTLGRDANPGEYPYVLALYIETPGTLIIGENSTVLMRFCTGTLITPTWVLTAAHCFVDDKIPVKFMRVRFGDMTKPSQEARECFRKVLRTVPHPGYFPRSLNPTFSYINQEDIALMQTEDVPVQPLGRLSAIEYKTLIGLPVTYAGYGFTKLNVKEKVVEYLISPRALQIGEGGIIPCAKDTSPVIPGTSLCVVAKCNNLGHYAHQGDSGGPLFYKDQIVGIASIAHLNDILEKSKLALYTPLSPYLEWIGSVIH